VIWAVLLVVAALAAPAVWAWYMSGRQLAATTETEQWRLVRLAAVVPAAVGVAILAVGVAAFVLTGYDWLVLALLWSFGLLHLGLLGWRTGRRRNRSGRNGAAR
jgi:hypothetical protein